MRFSFWPGPNNTWADTLELVRHAESTGWDGAWFADHFMPNTPEAAGPTSECWTTLAGLAAAVPRIRLGALVSGNTYRHPAVLANIAATADNISGGRIVLGLGAGWQENEHQKYGIPFYTLKERMDRFDEACQVVTGLLNNERATFQGRFYQLDDAPLDPKPVQQPLPLLVGGGGEKRTLRIAAKYADGWNAPYIGPAEYRHKLNVLDSWCEKEGRDPNEIIRSLNLGFYMSADEAGAGAARQKYADQFQEQAADRVGGHLIGSPAEVVDRLGEFQAEGIHRINIAFRPPVDWDALQAFVEQVMPAFD
jgi:F420-dependent oxidoreductase-like protein